jgi:predicted ester cyclase
MQQVQTNNLAIARQYIEQVLGKGNMAIADEIIDPNMVYHTSFAKGSLHGRDLFKQAISGLHQAFSHVNLTIEDAFTSADGERVVIRFNAPATHSGEMMGLAPTGKQINMVETHVIRLRNGKVVEDYASDNDLDFGVLFAPIFPNELPSQLGFGVTSES